MEGLKRAGKGLTRDKLIASLEGMSDYDMGGFRVKFSGSDHGASSFVDLTVIDKDGHIHS